MLFPTCPACGAQQIANAERCVQCGQPMATQKPKASAGNPYAETVRPFAAAGNPFADANAPAAINPYAPSEYQPMSFEPGAKLPLAGRGERLVAAIIDNIAFFVTCIPFFVGMALDGPQPDDEMGTMGAIGGVTTLLCMIALAILQCVMISTRGQTIGKRVIGIRIVLGRTNKPPGFVNGVLIRSVLIAFIGGFCNLFTLIDICCIFGQARRCIHDEWANTNVVQGHPTVR